MKNTDYQVKAIVLKSKLSETEANEIIESKMTSAFRGVLSKPKKDEVHIHSLILQYECILKVSARYTANYFRKTTHTISVDKNVSEVVLGDGIFPVKEQSSLKKALKANLGKNKIDVPFEEHVFLDESGELFFDHHGNEIKFPYDINSKTTENYPTKVLDKFSDSVKKPEISPSDAIDLLAVKLKKPMEQNVRDIKDEIQVDEVLEIYVPIYEARLIGPKNKVAILRLDAIRNKIL